MGSIPGLGTKISHAEWCVQKLIKSFLKNEEGRAKLNIWRALCAKEEADHYTENGEKMFWEQADLVHEHEKDFRKQKTWKMT